MSFMVPVSLLMGMSRQAACPHSTAIDVDCLKHTFGMPFNTTNGDAHSPRLYTRVALSGDELMLPLCSPAGTTSSNPAHRLSLDGDSVMQNESSSIVKQAAGVHIKLFVCPAVHPAVVS